MICGVHGIKNDVYLQFMSRNLVRSHLLIIEERKLCAMHNIERDSIDSSAYPLIYPKEEQGYWAHLCGINIQIDIVKKDSGKCILILIYRRGKYVIVC